MGRQPLLQSNLPSGVVYPIVLIGLEHLTLPKQAKASTVYFVPLDSPVRRQLIGDASALTSHEWPLEDALKIIPLEFSVGAVKSTLSSVPDWALTDKRVGP